MPPRLKRYKKGDPLSYVINAYACQELLKWRPDWVEGVYYQMTTAFGDGYLQVVHEAERRGIPTHTVDSRQLNKLGANPWMIARFRIPERRVGLPEGPGPVLALDTPRNRGNLGTIQRTALAFGIRRLALIGEACDPWAPDTMRASMGAGLALEIARFKTMSEFLAVAPRPILAFLTDGEPLTGQAVGGAGTFLFGSEGPGLDRALLAAQAPELLPPGPLPTQLSEDQMERLQAVRIPQSAEVDSLNLGVAVGIVLQAHYAAALSGGGSEPA
jgi:TrmH family RNA methyltransferase